MAVVENLVRQYETDSMGRTKRRCPTCQKLRFPGKAFRSQSRDGAVP